MAINILTGIKKSFKKNNETPDDLGEEDHDIMVGPSPTSEEINDMAIAQNQDELAKILTDLQNKNPNVPPYDLINKAMDILSSKKRGFDDFKRSDNMEQNIIQKSTSQLMAERYAQGVPTGAYAKSVSIQKASQPLTKYSNQKDILKETSQENTNDPTVLANASIEAIQDKYDALGYDAQMDEYNQNKVKDARHPIMAGNSIGAVRPRQNESEISMTEYTPEGLKNRALDAKSKTLASESPTSKKYSQDTYDQFESLMKKYGIKISPENYDAFIDDIAEAQSTGLNHFMNDAFLRKN